MFGTDRSSLEQAFGGEIPQSYGQFQEKLLALHHENSTATSPVNNNASFLNSEAAVHNIFNFIGDKNKFPGDRSKINSATSNHRTGSVTNKITGTTGSVATTSNRFNIGMGVERTRRLRQI